MRAPHPPLDIAAPGAGHGFSVPKNKDEERANVLSIGTATRFLKRTFGS